MSAANEFERRRWNDENWTAVWPKRERLTDEVTAYLLAAALLRPGEHSSTSGTAAARRRSRRLDW